MNFVSKIFETGFGQLNLGEKTFLAVVLLSCFGLVVYSICRVVRYSRRLQAIESQLLKLESGSGPA